MVTEVTDDALDTVLTQGGIALGAVGAAAVTLGWLLAGRLLQPLHRVTETARRIAEAPAADRGLHERIALRGPRDEIRELADTFDLMLERLDRAFDGQRRFIANASHELRTPLTLNRALIEVAVHRRAAPPELRQLGETLLEINTRHERLIDGLLVLARSERDVAEHAYVDLADIIEHVVGQLPAGQVTVQRAGRRGADDRQPGAAGTAGAEPGGERSAAQPPGRRLGAGRPATPGATGRCWSSATPGRWCRRTRSRGCSSRSTAWVGTG